MEIALLFALQYILEHRLSFQSVSVTQTIADTRGKRLSSQVSRTQTYNLHMFCWL